MWSEEAMASSLGQAGLEGCHLAPLVALDQAGIVVVAVHIVALHGQRDRTGEAKLADADERDLHPGTPAGVIGGQR
jgi:hypothetical protein